MHRHNQPFTVGLWTVKPGKEKVSISPWAAFANWTAKNQPGAGEGYLLQDSRSPSEFVSYGPWKNIEAIRAWCDRPEFKSFSSKVRELCSTFNHEHHI